MTKRRRFVSDLMSSATITLRESDRLSQAVREMTLASVRHLPVVDAEGGLVGLVSSHDLVAAIERPGDPQLSAFMTRRVISVRRETPAEAAVAIMIDQKVSALPVVGERGEVVGIVTATDFLVVAYQALTGAPVGRLASEI